MKLIKKLYSLVGIALIASLLCSCNSNNLDTQEVNENTFYYESKIKEIVKNYFSENKGELRGEKGDKGFDGLNGLNGSDGINGKDGNDGKDGIGIKNISFNTKGELIIVYTNDDIVNLGKISNDSEYSFNIYCLCYKPEICKDGATKISSITEMNLVNAIDVKCVNFDNNDYHASSYYHHHYIVTYKN